MMLVLLIFVFLIPWLGSRLFFEDQESSTISRLAVLLACMSLISISFFWCRILSIDFAMLLLVVFGLSMGLLLRHRKTILHFHDKPLNINTWQVTMLVLLLVIAGFFLIRYQTNWGAWDAIAVWNQHAIFLSDASYWQNMFSDHLAISHRDYPLFLSGLLGAIYSFGSEPDAVITALIATVPFFIIIAIYFSGLRQKSGIWVALVAIGILCLDRHFLARVASQYADTWLSLILLLGVYFVGQAQKLDKNQAVIAGIIMGTSLWTKNEGLIMFAIISAWFMYEYRNQKDLILIYFLGALPSVITLFYFKALVAPPSVITQSITLEYIWKSVTDISRYIAIAKELGKTTLVYYPLAIGGILFLIFGRKSFSRNNLTALIVITAILFSYLLFYLITPYEQSWHLRHSAVRLLHHLYPAFIFVILMNLPAYKYTTPSKSAAKSS